MIFFSSTYHQCLVFLWQILGSSQISSCIGRWSNRFLLPNPCLFIFNIMKESLKSLCILKLSFPCKKRSLKFKVEIQITQMKHCKVVTKITPQKVNEVFFIYSKKIQKWWVIKSGVMISDSCKNTITCICWYLALRVSFFALIAGASKWSSSANVSACALTTSILSYHGKKMLCEYTIWDKYSHVVITALFWFNNMML